VVAFNPAVTVTAFPVFPDLELSVNHDALDDPDHEDWFVVTVTASFPPDCAAAHTGALTDTQAASGTTALIVYAPVVDVDADELPIAR
jgi:hypothetical protein